ncbi:Patatin-like protein [Thalictrum thalictroides]|uniref:Patatin n=1 Tax=Thalictrum thalictroides TaxID=46969 RepID=A0A7J6VNA5_THATH|nr:Patatin-like protein [Thalictrum thalictroides]
MKAMKGPKYDGKYLRALLQGYLGEIKLNQTLTPVIIPTFDIKHLQPIIFSTFEAKRDELKNPLLSDVCISTSAAPIFLPAYHFKTSNSQKEERSFNLIDGGVAANNPTLIAMSMITRELLMLKEKFFTTNPLNYGRFLVISLGTGSAKEESKFDASEASKWGMFGWLYNGDSMPLLDAFSQASADMVDIHAYILFQALLSEKYYLRIELGNLSGTASSVDVSTETNMRNLIQIGNDHLKKPMSRVNLETGVYEEAKGEGSNADALARFAKILSEERRARQALFFDL